MTLYAHASSHVFPDQDFIVSAEECRADTAVLYSTVPGNDLVRPVVHTICKVGVTLYQNHRIMFQLQAEECV